jgi:hypothetical protein
VISTPVTGKPHVLYVEGGVLREPGSARYLEKALEHEDVDVRCADWRQPQAGDLCSCESRRT